MSVNPANHFKKKNHALYSEILLIRFSIIWTKWPGSAKLHRTQCVSSLIWMQMDPPLHTNPTKWFQNHMCAAARNRTVCKWHIAFLKPAAEFRGIKFSSWKYVESNSALGNIEPFLCLCNRPSWLIIVWVNMVAVNPSLQQCCFCWGAGLDFY